MKQQLLCLFLAFFTSLTFSQSVFINEIHYDNDGADTEEGIEVAGPVGTDLSGWTFVLYNGSTGSVYNTINLTSVLLDMGLGYGVEAISLPSNGLQNGAPDGIALVDASSNVVQFLSYEGSLTAVDGPAAGMTSTDIGVSQSSATPIGSSLQLTGTATEYDGFIWETVEAATFGAINTNQFFSIPSNDPVINEFVFNHTSTDANEYVEVFGLPNTDLTDFWVLEIEGDSNALGTVDGAFQLGTTNEEGIYVTPFMGNEFENGTVTLLLVRNFTGSNGDVIDMDADGVIDTVFWDEIVDEVGVNDSGAGDFNYTETVLFAGFDGVTFTVGGASRIPDGTDSDSASDWVRNNFNGAGLPDFPDAEASIGEALNTPGATNEVYNGDGGGEAVVLINEIDADTDGTDIMEFVELYDGGVGNTPLDGLTLVLYNGSNNESYNAFDLDGYSTNASGYFVLGNEGVANVNLVFGSNGLQNGVDAVALYMADATDFPNGTAVSIDNLVDALVYDTNDSDDAELLVLLNENQPQINEGFNGDKDLHSIQRYENGSGGLRNTETYVAAIPTPGAINTNALEQVDLVINELDADTPGTDTAEFIEIFDGGSGNTSLDGFVVVLYNGNGDSVYNTFDLNGYETNAEGYFVLGNEGVANVSLTFGSNGLQNGADAVGLYQGSPSDYPIGSTVSTVGLIDAVVYGTDDADDTELLVLLNAGEPQLNENAQGDKDNESLQRIPNGQGGLRNTSSFVTASPSPGTENGAVVVPTEPVSIAEARSLPDGTPVTVSGVLTVADNFAGPAYIQDTTGGIAVFDELVHGGGFAIGDSITVTATRSSFNNQIQLGGVAEVVDNGLPNNPIQPKDITLSEIGDHRGELVRIVNISFPAPGNLLFGNSNYVVTDASGSGELRIDTDVDSLVGLAQPENCSEAIGVVGTFEDFAQLLPRSFDDLPCAEPFDPDNGVDIPKEDTFDIVSWNIEWFGDEGNSPPAGDPNSDAIQKDSVVTVLRELDADIFAVVEISDDTLFAQAVSELEGYDFILSEATSYPNEPGTKQKIGFVYKTETVTPKETKALLSTIHPYYNGGDTSYLTDYPEAADRFYASGRLPFLMSADVTVNGATEEINIVALHARANSNNGAQSRYDMRRYDVEVLKDSLDVMFPDGNLIIAGDYNDDVDETVADGINTKESSYLEYVNDTENYFIPTAELSEKGFRSYVFRENMIDHISVSDELSGKYIENTAAVHYEFYDSDYTFTVSDHFPVSVRLQLKELTVDEVIVTDVSCNGATDGAASVSVSGGAFPYEYEWSTGDTTSEIENLEPGIYSVTITDGSGNSITRDFEVTAPESIVINMSEPDTLFTGYGEQQCVTIFAESITGGSSDYTYMWNTGESTENISVCPEVTTTYALTVTDSNGCSVTENVVVEVIDVNCSNNPYQQKVEICFNGKSLCISENAVPMLLKKGAVLGSCGGENSSETVSVQLRSNPIRNKARLNIMSVENTKLDFAIYDMNAQLRYQESGYMTVKGECKKVFDFSRFNPGIYIMKVYKRGSEIKDLRIRKK
ncbi:endonuclease [Galbibacter sp. EGI 63066]|uniref:endonuclease/exonuclease/phosphatase family protein n=1 Tax=Galbibacter sp. EGI 63066 TaxID=2993559 RepID=UPI0022490127|nr:DUF5689 domain-containing protein [Galbibacter sp. EGI 63066]MCX2681012.1 endonuclease [Galbibacter sp. EGI 63066]